MKRTEMLQEIRKMRFDELYVGWQEERLSQQEAPPGQMVTTRYGRPIFHRPI